jgi:hypothetical protein
MSSTRTINFSLRQNKGIERAIAFDALRQAVAFIGSNPVYVGLGSLWFRDFQIAHRMFDLDKMISIESDERIFARAEFNRPYGCIEVVGGDTKEILPRLLVREDLAGRPWIVWLDYDSTLDDDRISELANLVETLRGGSVLLVTFNAKPSGYGRDTQRRREAVTELFGADIVDPDLPVDAFDGSSLMKTLAKGTLDYLVATSVRAARHERFVPGISLLYRDSAPMVTVGGFLPEKEQVGDCEKKIAESTWFGIDDMVIKTEPLTMREVNALSRLLPGKPLSRERVLELGFEIDEDQLRFFERHYLRYPLYAEIV